MVTAVADMGTNRLSPAGRKPIERKTRISEARQATASGPSEPSHRLAAPSKNAEKIRIAIDCSGNIVAAAECSDLLIESLPKIYIFKFLNRMPSRKKRIYIALRMVSSGRYIIAMAV